MNLLQIDPGTIEKVANGPNGMYFIIGALGIFLILAIIMLITGKSFKDLFGHKPDAPAQTPVINNIISPGSEQPKPLDQPIQMSVKTFRILVNTIIDVDDEFEGEKASIVNKYNKIVIAEQDQCIKKVIDTFSLEYSSAIEDVADSENLDESTKILDLYLQTDLNKILISEFNKLKEDNNFEGYSSEDITSRISRIVENIVREMRKIIRGYIIINKDIFLKLFDVQVQALKDNVSIVVNKYISSDKYQRADIEKAISDRQVKLETRLKDLIEVI
jgi:hypothetical protein